MDLVRDVLVNERFQCQQLRARSLLDRCVRHTRETTGDIDEAVRDRETALFKARSTTWNDAQIAICASVPRRYCQPGNRRASLSVPSPGRSRSELRPPRCSPPATRRGSVAATSLLITLVHLLACQVCPKNSGFEGPVGLQTGGRSLEVCTRPDTARRVRRPG